MPTYNAGSASVEIKPSLKGFAKDLRSDLERIQAKYSVDVDADLTRFRAQMAALRDTTLNVDVDTDGAEAKLALLARDRTVNIDIDDKGGLARTARGAKDAERNLSRASGVKFGALTAAIVALVPALLGAVGAAGALATAVGAIGATGLVGSGGMLGTFMAMKESSDAAGQAADDLRGKQEAAEKAARDVADAQRDLVEAQHDAKKAQDDLSKSYEEGRRALRDLNDAATDAVLAQEDAEIALARAQSNRMKVYRDGSSTNLDRRQADNDVRKARQRLMEARSDRADAANDAASANAKGIAGSEPVQQAQERARDADQKVVDSQNRLADAMRNLTKAQEEQAKGAPGVDKFQEALAKLAPSAREFVLAVKALGPSWTDLRLAVQQPLFEGLGDSVTQFTRQNLPGLKAGMVEIAEYMNSGFKNTLSTLSSEFAQLSADGRMAGVGEAVKSAMEGMPGLIGGVTNSLITMTDAVAPTIGPLLQSLGDVFKQMGPSLGIVGAALSESFANLMPQFGAFVNALSEGLAPVLPVLGRLLGALGDALQPLIPPLSMALQVIGNTLAEALPVVAPFFAEFVGLLGDLLKVVQPLLPPLLQVLSAVLTPMATVLRTIVQTGLIPFAQTLANALKPAIDKLAPILAEVGKTIGAAWTEALQKLMPHMPKLITALVDASTAMLPILPPLAEIAVTLLPLMAETLAIMLPYLADMIRLFGETASFVAPALAGALGIVADVLGAISDAAAWVGKRFDDIVQWVTGLGSRIASAAGGMWDGIKDAFKAMLNWIFKAWNDMSLTLTIPVVNKRVTIDTPDIPLLKADGGLISGPGTATSDSIPALLSDGEYVVRQAAVAKYGKPFFDEVNAGRYADGGYVSPPDLAGKGRVQLGDISGPGMTTDIQRSMWDTVRRQFPDVVLFSATRTVQTEGHADYHNAGKAIDITPSAAINDWIAQKYPDSLEMFFDPGKNIKNGQPTSPIGGHGDHIHWAYDRVLSPVRPIADPKNPNAGATPAPYDPNQQNNQDGRDAPQKYAPDPVKNDDRYPTSLSGWAGFVAKGFAEGYTKSTLDALNISDTPNWLHGAQELDKQVGIQSKDGRFKLGSYQNPPADGQTPHPGQPDQPNNGAPNPAGNFVSNTPDGKIAAGTPGAKEAFWEEWGRRGWQDTANWLDTLRLYNGESGWRADAQNPSSGAYGIAQFLGEDKKKRWPGYFTPDPKAQAGPAAEYILERYKTPSGAWAFWQNPVAHGADPGETAGSAGHWYDRGGWLMPGTTVAHNETGKPEAVLTAEQWATADRAVRMMAPQMSASMAGGQGYSGGYVDNSQTHISTARVEEAFREDQARRERRAAGFVRR